MTESRKRRIVRRTVMALTVVLLPVWYAGSVATLIFLLNARIVPLTTVTRQPVEAFVTPLWWYMESGWPGAKACHEMVAWSKKTGQQMAGNYPPK